MSKCSLKMRGYINEISMIDNVLDVDFVLVISYLIFKHCHFYNLYINSIILFRKKNVFSRYNFKAKSLLV